MKKTKFQRTAFVAALCLVVSFLIQCGPGRGIVQIFIAAEDTVSEGLTPGDGEENIQDGWTVTYDKFIVSVGDFHGRATADAAAEVEVEEVKVIDLTKLNEAGLQLASVEAPALRFDKFGYSFLRASASAENVNVDPADFAAMDGQTLLVEGTLQKADGESCVPGQACRPAPTVRFSWTFAGETRFDACAAADDAAAGFAVTAGGTVSIKPTLHGDHWFFTNDPHATTPKRLAQWIANCDADADGVVTREELAAQTNVAALFSPALGYNLSSLPVQPIETAFHYFSAQTRTLGHFAGDGECEDISLISRDPLDPADLELGALAHDDEDHEDDDHDH